MPRISQYYGMRSTRTTETTRRRIFHAIYGEFEATVSIKDGKVLEGELPKRALKLVKEWAKLHKSELQENWDLASSNEPLKQVEALE
jgi:hypothetical protein